MSQTDYKPGTSECNALRNLLNREVTFLGVVRVLFSVITLAATILWVVLANWLNDVRCDDGCSSGSIDSWTDSPNSWLWDAQLVIAVVAMACALTGVLFAVSSKQKRSIFASATSYILFALWIFVLSNFGALLF